MSDNVVFQNLSSARPHSGKDRVDALLLTEAFWRCVAKIEPSPKALITALLNIVITTFDVYGEAGVPKETVLHDLEMFKRDITEGLEMLNGMKERKQ